MVLITRFTSAMTSTNIFTPRGKHSLEAVFNLLDDFVNVVYYSMWRIVFIMKMA